MQIPGGDLNSVPVQTTTSSPITWNPALQVIETVFGRLDEPMAATPFSRSGKIQLTAACK